MTNSNSSNVSPASIKGTDIFQIFLQDEDGQNILSIDDGALRQSLRIEIVNTSGRNIEYQNVGKPGTQDGYHFCILFRPGTLVDPEKITLKKEDGKEDKWEMINENNTFYFLRKAEPNSEIKNGERVTLTLENIGAAPQGGSRGTRVEIKYNHLQYQGSTEIISGHRLEYLNIVNQRGKKQVPIYAGFLGSNTILNDGTENELTLTIQSFPNQTASLSFLDPNALGNALGDVEEVSETRWQGDIVEFVKEKLPAFKQTIKDIENEQNTSQAIKDFLELLTTFLTSKVTSKDSFQELKLQLNSLNLTEKDKKEITKILINSLVVVSQDDLNVIKVKLQELLLLKPTDIQEVIKSLETLQVIKIEPTDNRLLKLNSVNNQRTLDDEATKFTISFDVSTEDSSSKHWALVEKTNADDIFIGLDQGQNKWVFAGKTEMGITPRWNFICKQELQLNDRQEILRLKITNLKTQLLSGYANLYVHYENIPGYWDGYITVPIHKGPLVYRECEGTNKVKVGCVGIGTDEPQAKLHIKTNDKLPLALKVDGNTAITGKLAITEITGSLTLSGNYDITLQASFHDNTSTYFNKTEYFPVLKIGNRDLNMPHQTGLNTIILDSEGFLRSKSSHSIYYQQNNWNDWAIWVDSNSSNGDIIAVTSYDAIANAPRGGSAEALLNSVKASEAFGLEKTLKKTNENHLNSIRTAYILLFIKGQNNCRESKQLNNNSQCTANLKISYYELQGKDDKQLKVQGNIAIAGNLQVDGKNNIIPVGSIFPYAGAIAPKGWLFCNGQAYKRTQFPELFEIIGTTYGGNNDEFKVPDLGGRFSVGVSPIYSLALTGGEEKITLTPEQMPSHQHNVRVTYSQNQYSLNPAVQQQATNRNRNGCDIFHYTLNSSTSNQNATVDENIVGSGSPHENRPPFLALNYIIKF